MEKLELLERQTGQRQFPTAQPTKKHEAPELHEKFDRVANDDNGKETPDRDYRSVFKVSRDKASKKPGKNKGDDMDR